MLLLAYEVQAPLRHLRFSSQLVASAFLCRPPADVCANSSRFMRSHRLPAWAGIGAILTLCLWEKCTLPPCRRQISHNRRRHNAEWRRIFYHNSWQLMCCSITESACRCLQACICGVKRGPSRVYTNILLFINRAILDMQTVGNKCHSRTRAHHASPPRMFSTITPAVQVHRPAAVFTSSTLSHNSIDFISMFLFFFFACRNHIMPLSSIAACVSF